MGLVGTPSLVILGCGTRKRKTSRLLPAIDRYDGPTFRVFRKHAPYVGNSITSSVLSGRFGLISGDRLIPRYDRRLSIGTRENLIGLVHDQLKLLLDNTQPNRIFISVGELYWPLLAEPLHREVPASKLTIARGGIGGRASQLASWFGSVPVSPPSSPGNTRKPVTLLGTTIQMSPAEVIARARRALQDAPVKARRFETWFVQIGPARIAPKYLVSLLFHKDVAQFRTADARRVLAALGVSCAYAHHN